MSPRVEVPDSVGGVIGALGDGGLVIAGGTNVMPRLNTEAQDVSTLVSLRRAGLSGIEKADDLITIGAATTLAALGSDQRVSFLHPVVESIASPTIRNLATVGGNLFVEQPYGDLAVALLALAAQAEVAGPDGGERIEVEALLADGLAPRRVVSSVSFRLPRPGEWSYLKAMRRRLNSASIVTVAAVVEVRDGVVTSARIALGGAGRRPVRASGAEAALIGGPLDREHVAVAGAAAAADAEPISDAYASAWYRRRVLPVHLRRALLGE